VVEGPGSSQARQDPLRRFADAAKDNPYQRMTDDYFAVKEGLDTRVGKFIKVNPDLFTRPPKP
jgi:hypothetical protein